MITLVGGVFIAAGAWALVFKRSAFPYVLAASAPFLTTAAVSVGQNNVTPFYVLAIPATFIAGTRAAVRAQPRVRRVLSPLFLLLWYSAVISTAGPMLFRNHEVLIPRGGLDAQVVDPGALEYSISLLAQMGYLVLACGVVLFFLQEDRLHLSVISTAFAVGVVLSTAAALALRYGLFPWPEQVFYNFSGLTYWTHSYEGVIRHRGIYSEPSYLAVFCVAAFLFFAVAMAHQHGAARTFSAVMLVLAAANLSLSYAGTAVAGGAAVVAIFLAWHLGRFLFSRRRLPPGAFLALLAAAGVSLTVGQHLWSGLVDLIADKTETVSFDYRLGADLFSLDLFLDTFGLGVGLGANRPSSFLTSLLSCIGIVGTLAFSILVYRACRPLWGDRQWSPAAWALLATVVCKVVADPAPSTPMMWFLIAVCAHAATRSLDSSEHESHEGHVVAEGVRGVRPVAAEVHSQNIVR